MKAAVTGIVQRLEKRAEHIDPRGGYPTERDLEYFNTVEADGKENMLFFEGYWDDVKTELRVMSGFFARKTHKRSRICRIYVC